MSLPLTPMGGCPAHVSHPNEYKWSPSARYIALPINKSPVGLQVYQRSIIKPHPVTYPTLWTLTGPRPLLVLFQGCGFTEVLLNRVNVRHTPVMILLSERVGPTAGLRRLFWSLCWSFSSIFQSHLTADLSFVG